jgi:PKD repeat protein
MPGRKHRSLFQCLAGLLLFFVAGLAHAQLVANDDFFGVPYGEPLVVEPLGVLKNDTLNGEDFGGTAELVTGVTNGTMTCLQPLPPADPKPKTCVVESGKESCLCNDGSFEYVPGSGFSGTDSFTYRALDGTTPSAPATVTLTDCTEGPPDVFACWLESSYLVKLAELGYSTFQEGIEGAEWDVARSPVSVASVTSMGIEWTSNHPTNNITTGTGPARTGVYGVYDPSHGFATGSVDDCDVDNPDPLTCLLYDGFSGTRVGGVSVLHGAGGYITGSSGANVSITHGATQTDFGALPDSSFQFFGVIDDRPPGFSSFEFRELDGKVGQELFIFGDDFTFGIISGGNISPVADPNGPYTGTVGSPVTFDGMGSFDPDGTIVAYDWNFGDGTVVLGAGPTPSHTYGINDFFTVTLTVTDNDGATSTITTSATIDLANVPPTADPGGPYTGTAGNPVSFDGSFSDDPDGTIASFAWDFDDGGTGTGETPNHTYAADGVYTVTLTVTDNDAAASTPTTTTATIVAGGSDFTIGGMVSGLAGTGLELQINAGEILGIGANGVFTFATPLADSSDYTVTVLTQPGDPTQSCGVTDGNGTLNGADITDVVVTCVTPGEEIIFADGFED